MSKASDLCIARARQSKGLPLTERQKELLYESKFPKPKKPRAPRVKTEAEIARDKHKKAKRRAKFAINCNEGDKWFQKWIDWEDKTIPVGKNLPANAAATGSITD